MARTLKIKNVWFDVVCDFAATNEKNQLIPMKFDCEGMPTKSVRRVRKTIQENCDEDNLKLVWCGEPTFTKREFATSYSIHASNEEIIAACVNAGLNVEKLEDVTSDEFANSASDEVADSASDE